MLQNNFIFDTIITKNVRYQSRVRHFVNNEVGQIEKKNILNKLIRNAA